MKESLGCTALEPRRRLRPQTCTSPCPRLSAKMALSDMTRVSVLSGAVRGRARLCVPGLRDQPGLALQLQDRLAADDRVHRVRPSTLTGNVLVLFDGRRLGLAELRRQVAREAAGYRPRREATPAADRALQLSPPDDGTAWHTLTPAAVMRSLNESPAAGLTADEAARRLLDAGPNRLPVPTTKSALEIIWEQIGSLPMLLLGGRRHRVHCHGRPRRRRRHPRRHRDQRRHRLRHRVPRGAHPRLAQRDRRAGGAGPSRRARVRAAPSGPGARRRHAAASGARHSRRRPAHRRRRTRDRRVGAHRRVGARGQAARGHGAGRHPHRRPHEHGVRGNGRDAGHRGGDRHGDRPAHGAGPYPRPGQRGASAAHAARAPARPDRPAARVRLAGALRRPVPRRDSERPPRAGGLPNRRVAGRRRGAGRAPDGGDHDPGARHADRCSSGACSCGA